MSLHLAVVTLVAVAYVNLASTEEDMGLCYRCSLPNLENNEGSAFAWVRSFLQEMKSRCLGLKTRRRNTPQSITTGSRSLTSPVQPIMTPEAEQQTSATPPLSTTTGIQPVHNYPSMTPIPKSKPPTTTDQQTPTTDPPSSYYDHDPPSSYYDQQWTRSDPSSTPKTTTRPTPESTLATLPSKQTTKTIDLPTITTDPPTAINDPPTTTNDFPGYADCQALLDAGHNVSGVYNITPAQYPDGLEVYCDMTTDSKGWIVFQRRVDGMVNFTRSWAKYRDGFGDKEGEFWLGNEILRRLTEPVGGEQGWEMRVDLTTEYDKPPPSGVYDDFHVDGESYTLNVGAVPSLNYLSDALSPTTEPSSGQPFSTYDQDNDAEPSLNCADELKGGWWFNRCTPTDPDGYDNAGPHSNLNGEYSQTSDNWVYGRGIVWSNVNGQITRSEMKMRRKI